MSFGLPEIDLDGNSRVEGRRREAPNHGLTGLAKQRKVKVVTGEGQFTSPNTLRVATAEGARVVRFQRAIIAAGSEPLKPEFIPPIRASGIRPRRWRLSFIPKRMLVLGGGIIGLEMATVYHSLGAGVTVIEMTDRLMPGADRRHRRAAREAHREALRQDPLEDQGDGVDEEPDGLKVSFEGPDGAKTEMFDALLLSVGRRPTAARIGAEAAGVKVNERGFIAVDRQMRTNVPHIFAIGDIVGEPMLAHKASHEGKVAAEVASGHKSAFDAKAIPSVAYTDPEIAWMGLTETEAKAKGVKYGKAVFPWAASGRSLSSAATRA